MCICIMYASKQPAKKRVKEPASRPSIHPPIRPSVHLSIHLRIHPSIHLLIHSSNQPTLSLHWKRSCFGKTTNKSDAKVLRKESREYDLGFSIQNRMILVTCGCQNNNRTLYCHRHTRLYISAKLQIVRPCEQFSIQMIQYCIR